MATAKKTLCLLKYYDGRTIDEYYVEAQITNDRIRVTSEESKVSEWGETMSLKLVLEVLVIGTWNVCMQYAYREVKDLARELARYL